MKGTETLAQAPGQILRQVLRQVLGRALAPTSGNTARGTLPRRRAGWRGAAQAALLAMATCSAVAASYGAAAQSSPVPHAASPVSATPVADAGCAWPVAGSVEALLQAETEIALRTRRGTPLSVSRLSGLAPEPASPSASPSPSASAFAPSSTSASAPASPAAGLEHADRVAVAAIYGVGRALHVDMRINGQLARYRKGQRWPEHAPTGGTGVYALAAVLGECVRLQSGESARVACLDALGSMEAKRN